MPAHHHRAGGRRGSAAAQHAAASHGHEDTPELREQLRAMLEPESAYTPGERTPVPSPADPAQRVAAGGPSAAAAPPRAWCTPEFRRPRYRPREEGRHATLRTMRRSLRPSTTAAPGCQRSEPICRCGRMRDVQRRHPRTLACSRNAGVRATLWKALARTSSIVCERVPGLSLEQAKRRPAPRRPGRHVRPSRAPRRPVRIGLAISRGAGVTLNPKARARRRLPRRGRSERGHGSPVVGSHTSPELRAEPERTRRTARGACPAPRAIGRWSRAIGPGAGCGGGGSGAGPRRRPGAREQEDRRDRDPQRRRAEAKESPSRGSSDHADHNRRPAEPVRSTAPRRIPSRADREHHRPTGRGKNRYAAERVQRLRRPRLEDVVGVSKVTRSQRRSGCPTPVSAPPPSAMRREPAQSRPVRCAARATGRWREKIRKPRRRSPSSDAANCEPSLSLSKSMTSVRWRRESGESPPR